MFNFFIDNEGIQICQLFVSLKQDSDFQQYWSSSKIFELTVPQQTCNSSLY